MQIPANDNALASVATRPSEFDAHLTAAYPRLLARAKRFTRDPEPLAQQTAMTALHRWASFRQTPGKPYYGFYTWLCWVMKGSAADFKDRVDRRIVMVSSDAMAVPPVRTTSPAQEASADLGAVLSVLAPRERDVLLRRVAGEQCWEIAADWGVTKQRVSQIEFEARAKVLAAAGLVGANDNVRVAA